MFTKADFSDLQVVEAVGGFFATLGLPASGAPVSVQAELYPELFPVQTLSTYKNFYPSLEWAGGQVFTVAALIEICNRLCEDDDLFEKLVLDEACAISSQESRAIADWATHLAHLTDSSQAASGERDKLKMEAGFLTFAFSEVGNSLRRLQLFFEEFFFLMMCEGTQLAAVAGYDVVRSVNDGLYRRLTTVARDLTRSAVLGESE